MKHPILLNKSEKEVLNAVNGFKTLDGRKIFSGRGRYKMSYTKRYIRHDKAIEFLKEIGILGVADSCLVILRGEYTGVFYTINQ